MNTSTKVSNNSIAENSQTKKSELEFWKDIPDFEGYYQISNLGNVKSLDRILPDGRFFKGRYLTLDKMKSGYIQVSLYKNCNRRKYYVHRLIALSFLNPCNNKPCVNHIDGDKSNNVLENLEWATHSENNIHAYENNLKTPLKGEDKTLSKLTNEKVRYIRKTIGVLTNQEVASKFSVSRTVVSNIRTDKTWKHVV